MSANAAPSSVVPPALGDPFNLIEPLLTRQLARGLGENPALICDSEVITYRSLARQVSRTRELLIQQNVGRGDRVALLLPDVPAYVYLFLATISLGAIAVPINPRHNPQDVEQMMRHVGVKRAFVHEAVAAHLPPDVIGSPELVVITVDSTLERLLQDTPEAPFEEIVPEVTSAADPVYLLFSSGTTGRPKAIIRRHVDIPWTAVAFADHALKMNERDRVLAVSKLTFGYSLVGNLLFSLLYGGAAILIPEASTPRVILDAIERHRPTILLAQPRMLAELTETMSAETTLDSVRVTVSAGDVLSEAVRRRWKDRTGQSVIDGFGSTEAGHIFLCNDSGQHPPDAVGRALPGYELKIVDENGATVGDGVPGRLCIRGGSVSPGYWNDAVRTRRGFSDGWFVSDDVFTRREGFYFYSGRWDDVIKTGCGEWVLPHRLEGLLLRDPAVRDCAVVGAHDERDVVRVKACVVRAQTAEPGNRLAERLKGLVAAEWPELDYMRIHMIEFIDAIPRSANGKVQRHRLHPKTLTEFAYECG